MLSRVTVTSVYISREEGEFQNKKKKVKLSLYRAMEAHRVVKR
jgi:hypothetical protein